MTGPAQFPSLDLGGESESRHAASESAAALVDRAFRDFGFLVVTGHGIPSTVIERAWDAARLFFDLPDEQKLAVRPSDPRCPRGYLPLAAETLTRSRGVISAPDPKECYSSGQPRGAPAHLTLDAADADFFFGANLWPTPLPAFKTAWLDYYRAMEGLAESLLSHCARALNLPENFFRPSFDHHASALRALNYPPLEQAPAAAAVRAGAHTDYGSLTILKPDPAARGLEIRLPSGRWVEAPPVTDGFLVNVGDLLARWTNDRWISTLHRVSSRDGVARRQSIAFFQNPNFDAQIACLPGCATKERPARYRAVLAGEYLRERFTSTV